MSLSSLQLLKFQFVSKSYGPKCILSRFCLTLSRGDRLALIGENGCGKTTLAKLAMGLECPDEGVVLRPPEAMVGFLPQDLDLSSRDLTLGDFLLENQGHLLALSQRLSCLEALMAKGDAPQEVVAQAMEEWDRHQAEFVRLDGYGAMERCRRCLKALGLEAIDVGRPLSSLSGGEQRRAHLASILLGNPDLLILDEPTNHLDSQSLEWLEGYLKAYRGAALIISHDRHFLNKMASGIVEMVPEDPGWVYYQGNYDVYLELKKKEKAKRLAAYEQQQEEMASLKQFLKRQTFSSKRPSPPKDRNVMAYDKHGEEVDRSKRRSIARAKARLDVLESEKLIHPLPKGYTGLTFVPRPLESAVVLRLEQVTLVKGEKLLMRDFSEALRPGERVMLSGPNGCGKSTLLAAMAFRQGAHAGHIEVAPAVVFGYLSQEAILQDEDLTLLEYLRKRFPLSEAELRSCLIRLALIEERFLKQQVKSLSVGQKRRLQLLEISLSEANVLLLDEPTNHLAPHLIDQLEEALCRFPGAVMAATHDRRFAQRVGTTSWSW